MPGGLPMKKKGHVRNQSLIYVTPREVPKMRILARWILSGIWRTLHSDPAQFTHVGKNCETQINFAAVVNLRKNQKPFHSPLL
ncbi:hypothetical protein TNCV_145891 [Trichonephila clavipes]|nr:hypothetical protein TNCV_145891 [Trichonephila clavipes]